MSISAHRSFVATLLQRVLVLLRLSGMPEVAHYLDDEHLKSLNAYAYSAVDKSPLSNYVLRYWWTWTASLMPLWLAPNLITLIGFTAIAVNFLTIWIFCPDLVGPVDSWIYFSCALGLFFYQTMDNIDGKQARRTGTSSPLGELFDHGIDTLNCPLGGLVQAFAMGLGHSKYTVLCILVGCWSMYLSSWEEYHTGTLYLGYVNGPVEGVLLAVGVLLISAFKGSGWWAQTVQYTLGHLPFISDDAQMFDLMMIVLMVAFSTAHLPLCLINVYQNIKKSSNVRLLTSRQPRTSQQPRNVSQAYLQLLPMILFSVFSVVWIFSPYSIILSQGHLMEYTLVVAFIFGQLSSKIILAQLTKGVFPFSPALIMPLLAAAIAINTPALGLPRLFSPAMEAYYLHFILLLSCASYFSSVQKVLTAFCTYLNIECLRIPYQPNANPSSKNGQALESYPRRRSNTSEFERGGGSNMRDKSQLGSVRKMARIE